MSLQNLDILENLDVEIARITLRNKIEGILHTSNTTVAKPTPTVTHTPSIQTTVKQDPAQQKSKTKKSHSILDSFIFLIKYLTTTAAIFAVLMFTTNYSAYYQIALSYINSEEIAQSEQGLISSVEAASNETEVELNSAPEENRKQKYEQEQYVSKRGTSYSIDTLTAQTKKESAQLDIAITPYENRIIIPSMGKNIPLVEVTQDLVEDEKELNDIFMKDLENGVVRYPSSVKPGEDGNTFIFGHSSNFPWIKGNYNEVFALLDKVSYGDEVIIYYEQKKYTYIIREKSVIDPNNVGVIKKHSLEPRLTLMTCWPIGTTLNRLIVSGELVEESDI